MIEEMIKEINIDISTLTFDDFDDLVELNEKYMFYGPSVRPHFEEVLRTPANIALKCTVNNEFAGAFICVKGIALVGNHDELVARIEYLTKGKSVYTGDTIAVKPEYRRLGLARRLCAAMIAELRKRGAELILNEYWVYPDGSVPSLKALDAFKKAVFIGRFENFYKEYNNLGYTCSICGAECVCTADIYIDEIPGKEDKT